MHAAATPASLPQQQQRVELHQQISSTRGGETEKTSSGGGNGGKIQHQTHAARISEVVAKDLAALANPDVSTPFASVEDAIDRLLPYHLLAQEGPEAADADEVDEAAAAAAAAASTSGRNGGGENKSKKKFLLLSRRQAWLEVASRRAAASCDAAERLQELAEEAIKRSERACEERKEEAWLVAQWEREAAEAAAARAATQAASAAVPQVPGNPPPAPLPPPPAPSAGYY